MHKSIWTEFAAGAYVLRLKQVAGETVEHIPALYVLLAQPALDYIAGNFVGHKLAGVDVAFSHFADGRAALYISPENVARRNVSKPEAFFEHTRLSSLACAGCAE